MRAALPSRRQWLGAIVIIGLTLLAYLPVFRAGFIWDDPDNIPQVPFQRTVTFLKWIWFRLGATQQFYPLTHTMFWAESRLWGLHPAGYHAVNLALHLANALLLWRLLRRLNVGGCWLAAAIFAVHPVLAESVAWVTEGKNTLSGFFYLLAMNLAVSAWGLTTKPSTPVSGVKPAPVVRWQYALCLLFFVAAMLSKTATCTFPAAVALLVWWEHGRLTRRDVLLLLPFLAVALGMAWLTSSMERWNVGAVGLPELALSPSQRLLIAGRAIWFYAAKLVWPAPLTFIYPRWNVDSALAWQWVFPVAAAVVIAGLWMARRRRGRGPITAVLFFVGTLVPALGFVTVYAMRFSFVADHFQYLASIGLIVLGASMLWRIGAPPAVRRIGAAILLVGLAALTFHRTLAYRDSDTLWHDTLAKNPDCWLGMNNLGLSAQSRGENAQALSWFDRSLQVHPSQPEAHLYRGQLFAGERRYDEAEREYAAAIAALGGDVRVANEVEYDRARISAARGDLPRAARQYEKVLAASPGMEQARLEYAMVLQRLNRPQDALSQYQRALEINPDSVAARSALAAMLFRGGFLSEALRYMAEAVELDPNPRLCNNYGVMLMRARRVNDAAAQFSSAIAADPRFADAYDGLGYAMEAQGRFSRAEQLYRKALSLDPTLPSARQHLDHLIHRAPAR